MPDQETQAGAEDPVLDRTIEEHRRKKRKKSKTKGRLAVDLPVELLETARNLAVYLQRNGSSDDPQSLTGMINRFVEEGIKRTKRKHKLKTVPPRTRPLNQGRPITN